MGEGRAFNLVRIEFVGSGHRNAHGMIVYNCPSMDKALTWFINSWLILVLLANLVAIVGFFVGAETFWDGWTRVREVYSPFNVANFIMEVVSLSPALGAMYWRDRRRAAIGTQQRQSLSIGEYKLDAVVDAAGLTEFSAVEYAVMERQFEGEKNYNAPRVTFLSREWKLQLGTVNGKIYKIAPFLEFEDRKDADLAAKDTLRYCKEQMGEASEEKRGLVTWDTADGNVVLQPIDAVGLLGVSLFITSNSVRNFKRK